MSQFKVDFTHFREWSHAEGWFRKNSVVVAGNSSRDGVSGSPKGHGYGATIEEMFRFAHLMFSGDLQHRDYMLGRGSDPHQELARSVGGRKACLRESDLTLRSFDIDFVLSEISADVPWGTW